MNLRKIFNKNNSFDLPNIYDDFEIGDNVIFENNGVEYKAVILKLNKTTASIDYGEEIIDVNFKYIKKAK